MFKNIIGTHKPDILDCISNLSSDEVFTPPSVVNQVLDLFPNEVWSNPKLKFLDPACKSGVFLREIAKRLMVGLEKKMEDEEVRREHIFKNMLYGISITELTGYLARRSLYYSKAANSDFSILKFDNEQGNVHYSRGKHKYIRGKCVDCGAPEGVLDRGEKLENYAYQFIHKKEVFPMKFDVIIGNPPYQLQDAGESTGASPIYQHFISQAKSLSPKYISMIIPSRWFAGGKGLDSFRKEMLGDSQIRKIVDFTNASDCFPGVDIAGGVCYFLWEKDSSGECDVVNHLAGKQYYSKRPLNEFDTFIRYGSAVPIIRKIIAKKEKSLSNVVSSRKPFGLATNVRPESKGDLTLYWNGGEGPYKSELVTTGVEMIEKWKTITSKVSYDHGGLPDKDGQRRVLSKVEVLPPKTICTETYIVAGSFDNEAEAKNAETYLKTKFVRFLVSLLSFSQDITKDRFFFVPDLSMKKAWTDELLYKRYDLSSKEIEFIESLTKEML